MVRDVLMEAESSSPCTGSSQLLPEPAEMVFSDLQQEKKNKKEIKREILSLVIKSFKKQGRNVLEEGKAFSLLKGCSE